MASNVEIANIALLILGDETITSLADNSARARLANGLLSSVRRQVLRANFWNCAISRAALAQDSATPVHGWDYQYTLPPDCLRVISINEDESLADAGDDFKVEGRKLLTNETTVNLRYVKDISNPEEYDPLLYKSIACRLAADMAYAITGSASKAEQAEGLYLRVIEEARSADGQEGTPERVDDTSLIDVR